MINFMRFPALVGLLCLLILPVAQAQGQYSQYDDPPGRVAYINHSTGGISYSPAGEDIWLDVVQNRPLSRGDRLWTDRDSRLELQVGSGLVRLDAETSLEILELDDRISQLLITEGVMSLTVPRLHRDEYYEVATPNLAFTIDRAGRYRIDVDPRRDETTIVVWEGAGEAYGDGSTFPLRSGDTVRFYGADLRDYQVFGLPRADRFDRYSLDRDRRLSRSNSLRYVSDDMIGYASLDTYGSWRSVSNHGAVWFPTRVESDWAPYRDGRWVWQDPWGWTWVDNAPWGFAPSHYGRWVHLSNRWGWVPGPRNVRPVYAPALVAFVGGSSWSLNISIGGVSSNRGPIGWFPLGPRDVYVPSYRASRDYFTRVNVNNTVINNTTIINNVYNNYSSGTINVNQVNYANRAVSGAVTAVPSEVFVNSRPVRQQAIRMDSRSMANAEIMRVAQIAPDQNSVRGAAVAAQTKPGREVFDRRVIARTPPPPAALPIAARVDELRKNPGRSAQQRAVAPDRTSQTKPHANVRVIQDPTRAVNAREVASQRGGIRPDAAPAQRKPLDREVDARRPATGAQRGTGETDPTRQQQANEQRQREVQAQQQREQASERQRGAAEQRQREVNAQQQREQAVERQRQSDAREQQAERQRGAAEQRQREVNAQQQREQAVERQRQSDAREQQAERQRGAAEQRQREVNAQQQREQAVERQRQADAREQQAAGQREAAAQRQREANAQQQQREQAAERQRQAAEPRTSRPTPVEGRKPVPRKDPRTGKDVVEEDDDDDKKDKRKERDRS